MKTFLGIWAEAFVFLASIIFVLAATFYLLVSFITLSWPVLPAQDLWAILRGYFGAVSGLSFLVACAVYRDRK